MTGIPQAAIDAGTKAVLSQHGIEWRIAPTESVVWPVVWVALEAAAPHLRAVERERIRQLAIRNGAVCTGDEGTSCYFADLIRETT